MKAIWLAIGCVGAVTIDRHSIRDPYDQWIAYSTEQKGDVMYYNPTQDRSVSILPAGARQAPGMALLDTVSKTSKTSEPVAPWDGNCSPKCVWQCKHQECEKECKPSCDLPKCQTRCKNPDMGTCKVKCDQQAHCATFCPPQKPCKADAAGIHECKKPDCSTKCEKARCVLVCGETGQETCKNVCAEPKCSWKCKNPRTCPRPVCRLDCSQPNCTANVTNFALPDVEDGQQIMTNFTAQESPDWKVGPWSPCDCKSGKQYRDVTCNSPLNVCGLEATPPTSKTCDVPCKGYFNFGAWSACKGECMQYGYKSRTGPCMMGNCDGQKEKTEVRRCEYKNPRCGQCEAELFGGGFLDGWSKTVMPGRYNELQLSRMNILCKNVKSVHVKGFCCAAKLYQYTDFNDGREHKSWSAFFPEGAYMEEDIQAKGGFDQKAMSLEVFKDKDCIEMSRKIAERELRTQEHAGSVSVAALALSLALALAF